MFEIFFILAQMGCSCVQPGNAKVLFTVKLSKSIRGLLSSFKAVA
jgi:hypothetical protein